MAESQKAAAPNAAGSRDLRQAADKRKAAAETGATSQDAKMIAALVEERRGYVQRGLGERVAQVDAQIKLRGGYVPASPAKEPEKAADVTLPDGTKPPVDDAGIPILSGTDEAKPADEQGK